MRMTEVYELDDTLTTSSSLTHALPNALDDCQSSALLICDSKRRLVWTVLTILAFQKYVHSA